MYGKPHIPPRLEKQLNISGAILMVIWVFLICWFGSFIDRPGLWGDYKKYYDIMGYIGLIATVPAMLYVFSTVGKLEKHAKELYSKLKQTEELVEFYKRHRVID
jgi:hypothetical protein